MATLFNKWFFLLVFPAFFAFSTVKNNEVEVHPYHVSATEIEYNQKEKRLEISCKIFTDDFEDILEKLYRSKADFNNEQLKTAMTEMVKKYLITHLAIRSSGQIIPLQLYGWEVADEAVYVYAVAPVTNFNTKDIAVENTVLYDLFKDQMNIIHFIIAGTRKSTRLNYPDRKARFEF
ncbi:MAG: DUF6702 family protein [Niabella sp.]